MRCSQRSACCVGNTQQIALHAQLCVCVLLETRYPALADGTTERQFVAVIVNSFVPYRLEGSRQRWLIFIFFCGVAKPCKWMGLAFSIPLFQ